MQKMWSYAKQTKRVEDLYSDVKKVNLCRFSSVLLSIIFSSIAFFHMFYLDNLLIV